MSTGFAETPFPSVKLSVVQAQVLDSLRWNERVAPWNHRTLTALERLGLVQSELRFRDPADRRLAQTKTWRITGAGIDAYRRRHGLAQDHSLEARQ